MPTAAAGGLPAATAVPAAAPAPAPAGDGARFQALFGAAVGAAPAAEPAVLPVDASAAPLDAAGLDSPVDAPTPDAALDPALAPAPPADPASDGAAAAPDPWDADSLDALEPVVADASAEAPSPAKPAPRTDRARAAADGIDARPDDTANAEADAPDAALPAALLAAPAAGEGAEPSDAPEAAVAPPALARLAAAAALAAPKEARAPRAPASAPPAPVADGSSPSAPSPPPVAAERPAGAEAVAVEATSVSPLPERRHRGAAPSESARVEVAAASAVHASDAPDAAQPAAAQRGLRTFAHDDAEPLPESVRLNGVRAARVAVDLGDGRTVRGRVDVLDGEVDVRLHATEDAALEARRRAGELKDALDQRGLKLGRFTVEDEEQGRRERQQRRQRAWESTDEAPGGFFNRRA